VLATGNPHKVSEIAAILGPAFSIEPLDVDVVEDGVTFEDNALLKARAARSWNAAGDRITIADDSGIEVAALGNRPGVHSARWTDEGDWIPRVLRELVASGSDDRTARFVCAAAAVWPDGRELAVRGVVEGQVAPSARGEEGFGYDPIFIPDEGDGRTFGEMSGTEKQTLSHRGRAFRALGEAIRVR
jgi:XTP/dITP diphosphohydrolase